MASLSKFVLLGMLSVVILGTGHVAFHLYTAFSQNEHVGVLQLVGRNQAAFNDFQNVANTTTDFNAITDADIYLIAVNDDAISPVSKHLENKKGIVAHTSGSIAIDALHAVQRPAVFYPLQTFSKKRAISYHDIPLCLETKYKEDMPVLRELAATMSENLHLISSEQRKRLHLAAVFTNNFTNHLYIIGKRLCEEKNLSFDLLRPLIAETAEKIKLLEPELAQTGPAKRADRNVLALQVSQLNDNHQKRIYQTISQSILALYEKKL
ncbi:MAG: DUF2520 domain-containing protein [Bacteroidota bacterium]